MTVNGNTLTVNQSNTYTRIIDTAVPANPLVGAWRFDDTDGVAGSLVVLTLFESGIFVLAGDEALPSSDGIERGTYSVGTSNNVTFTRILDTTLDAGIFTTGHPSLVVANVVVNGDTMTFDDGQTYTGTRIRPPQ
jgi:hypothetical protein